MHRLGIFQRVLSLSILLGGMGVALPSKAADLSIADGVVIKFGSDAGMVVRDQIHTGNQTVFTSIKDDSAAGQTGSIPQTAAAGDWRGLKVEASAVAASIRLDDATILFGGASGAAALDIRRIAPTLNYLLIGDSLTGLRVTDAAAPRFNGLSLAGNALGMEVNTNASPVISTSSIQGNTLNGVVNLTPASIVQATGNWWGHATGPRDAVANAQGLGDAVSTGVNYASWLAQIPLINPQLRVVDSATYTNQPTVTLALSCRNAVEYRLAENGNFTGLPYVPMTPTASLTLSAGDGIKPVSVQYRSISGGTVTASLAQGILYDTQGPTLAITNPAEGSYITNAITVSATASDPAGVTQVEFYIDNQLAVTDTSVPYSYFWNAPGVPDGNHSIRVVATDAVGHTRSETRNIIVARTVPPPPDTSGPALSNLTLSGSAIGVGAILVRSGSLAITVSDPSGISRVEFLLGTVLLSTDTNGADGFATYLNLVNIPDGNHSLTVRAFDSLGNTSEASTAVVVALAAPATPSITAPANGLVTNVATVTVTGTAEPNVQVVAHNNGALVPGAAINVDAAGRYSLPLTLADGVNSIQIAATNRGGSSPLTTARLVTVDTRIPVTPLGLNAAAQPAGKIRLTWSRVLDSNAVGYNLYRAGQAFTTIAEAVKVNPVVIPVATTLFDDLPTVDGIYHYRLVAVNSLSTSSSPSNPISAASDNSLPRALEILYAPTGRTDLATGRIGAGRVNVTVRVNEALVAAPFLSIAPLNGTPIAVDLVRATDTEYRGFFNIAPGTPTGIAYAVFSARDVVGNRGTEITTGTSINIDAQGPSLTGLNLTPASPIKNDANAPVTVNLNLTFNEAIKPAVSPTLSYVLSANPLNVINITGLTQASALVWTGSFTLPASAGQTQSEQLTFAYSGLDDLDNASTTITAANSFQVYQGNLPPLTTPLDFAAAAQPAGRVRVSWRAVDNALGYQIYRQAPGEAALTAFQRVATGLEYIDNTTVDGLYRYTIASIRNANGQETISPQSAAAEVTADSVVPSAPQNMALLLIGTGIQATWQAPAGGAASYNLYRSSAASITDITGLTPIKTNVRQLGAIDANPSPAEHAYAVTALDAAGNESPVSNSVYLNFTLLPVATLTVVQSDTALPVISWTHTNPSAIAGYNVYLGAETGTPLNLTPLQTLSYTDTGYAGDERPYTVVAFDNNGAQIGRALTLPKISAELNAGTPLLRNVMNRLQYRVTNQGASAVSGIHMKAKVGTRQTSSELFSLAAGESKLIGVVVGGHADIPNPAVLISTIEMVPNEGERVSIVRTSNIAAQDGSLVLTVAPENLTRGGSGQVRFTLDNTSDVDIEILTANASGNSPSPDIRYKLIDKDGNVLTTQSFKQVLGGQVRSLATGQTVARIPARASFTSDAIALAVPVAAPDSVTVQLDIDRIHYKLGTPETVSINGLTGRQAASLIDTPYYGEITSITPVTSFGDQDIVIVGRAIARNNLQPLGNVALRLVFSVNGFERKFDVFTDTTGSFTHTFKPTAADGGAYKVSILHPDILVRPVHGQFVINSVVVSPTAYKLSNPRNYPFTIKFRATAGEGTTATNVRAVYEAQYQPSGSLPVGITVATGTPLTLASKQAGDLEVTVTGANSAAETGSFIIKVLVDEKGIEPVASLRIDYKLTDAKPALFPKPSYVETGLIQGGNVLEQLILENRGFAEAQGVTATLLNSDGTPAPTWIYLMGGSNLGNMAIGEKRTLDIAIVPPAAFAEGIYTYKLRIAAANTTGGDIPVYVSITQSGVGNALFKTSDIYTATLNSSGQLIPGLAGARITVQNELVPGNIPPIVTDSLGEAYFTNLPAGRYKFRATALNHQEVIGRFTVKPGVTATEDVFLDYNLVTVEWSVNEITLLDKYEIILSATYETNVPAAVVVLEPAGVTLPNMKAGDVFLGELTLTNYGLIRADTVKQRLPVSDPYIRYEFLVTVPDTLEAKSRITIPYRAVSLLSFDPTGTATGGGCFGYGASSGVDYKYPCANGNVSSGSTSTGWSHYSGSGCGGVGGPGGPSSGCVGPNCPGGGDGGGWLGSGGGSGGTPLIGACTPGQPCSSTCGGNCPGGS